MVAFTSVPVLRASSFTPATPAAYDPRPPSVVRPLPSRRLRLPPTAQLIGIPDDLRSNNLEPSAHEVLLGELRYSDPARLPMLIQSSIDMLDDTFYTFIDNKINATTDLEERDTLRCLRDAITDIMKQMIESVEASAQQDSSDASATLSASPGDASVAAANRGASAEDSYDQLIDQLVASYEALSDDPAAAAEAIKNSVDLNYNRIDMRMLERLSERIVSGGERAPLLAKVRDEISSAMNVRLTSAMESVKTVLSAGGPDGMRQQVDILAQEGRIDDAFILLLQGNMEEARKAGVHQAVQAISDLLNYASDVRDSMVEPELRLIRKLLRLDDKEERMQLLTDNLTPSGKVDLVDGSQSTGRKIDGKKFVSALRKLIEEYGNVDEKFVLKLSSIGEESEAVARKVYGVEDKDLQAYQDEMFHKRSVSIWDLEDFEHGETAEGREAPWEGRMGQIPENMGFSPDGKLSV